MKTQHTPGPWKIDDANTPVYSVGIRGGGDDAFIICDITDDGYSKEENDANAKLIAAAPDLLKALIYAKHTMEVQCPHYSTEVLDKAIKKAQP